MGNLMDCTLNKKWDFAIGDLDLEQKISFFA